jgi:hypothetical protein
MTDDTRRLLIELDVLLDTRLGTMAQYPELQPWVESLLLAGYRQRQSDLFTLLVPEFPQALFNERYSQRNETTLKCARVTPFVHGLTEIANNMEKEGIGSPFDGDVIVEINTYPYTLSDGVLGMLRDIVAYHLAISTQVATVRVAPEQITPKLLSDRYAALALYDLEGWLAIHAKELMTTRVPTVALIAPARYKDVIPTKEVLLIYFLSWKNPW